MITEKQKVADQNNPTLRASSLVRAPGDKGLRKGRGEGERKELALMSDKFKH